jgi:hypothetical protein
MLWGELSRDQSNGREQRSMGILSIMRERAPAGVVRALVRPPSYLPFVVGCLFCLVPLIWSGPGEIVQGADYNNPINSGREIGQIFSGWQPDNLGEPTFRQVPRLFPYLTFWKLGEAFGLSPGAIQRAWFVSLFVLCFLSAWALVKALIPSERRGWAAVIVVLGYMFNPFTVSSWSVGHNVQFLAYAVAPLWLLILYRTLHRPASMVSGVPLALISLLFASTEHNPPMILSMIVFTSLLLVVLVILSRSLPVRHVLARLGSTIPWLVLVNAWWLLPFVSAAADGTGYAYPGASRDLFAYPSLTIEVHFSEFIRGLGYWGEYASYHGVDYLPWAESFSHPLVIVATVWLVGLAFVPLLMRRKTTIAVLFASALSLVGIFISKGVNDPLAGVNRWLYLHAPGYHLMRGTYEKAGGLIFLAALIGLSIAFAQVEKVRTRVLLATATAVAIGAASWPLFTGAVMPDLNANGVAAVVRIPVEYNDLLEWTERAEGLGTILSVPQGPIGYIKTKWAYAGPDPIYNFSDVPVVTGAPDARRSDGPRFAAFLKARERFTKASYLRRLGITHVIARMDVDPQFYPGTPRPQWVEAQLQRNGFESVHSFGVLHVYAVPSEHDQRSLKDAKVDMRILPEAAIPYTSQLEGLDGRALVALPQSYDGNWTLQANGSEGTRVLEHSVVDGYANGWLIEGTGDISLQATYNPTVPVLIGIALSAATVLAGIALLARDKRLTKFRSSDPESRG